MVLLCPLCQAMCGVTDVHDQACVGLDTVHGVTIPSTPSSNDVGGLLCHSGCLPSCLSLVQTGKQQIGYT